MLSGSPYLDGFDVGVLVIVIGLLALIFVAIVMKGR